MLAYVPLTAYVLVLGLPLFVLIALLKYCPEGDLAKEGRVIFNSVLLFSSAYLIFLTDYGPFIGQKVSCERWMFWEITPGELERSSESEVLLRFADGSEGYVEIVSDELAERVEELGAPLVRVRFSITSDYGIARAYSKPEIVGLKEIEFAKDRISGRALDSLLE